ncbi:MAG TPA: metal-dependent hydrolase [Ktedonobacteraceae bacterium]|nr:metal-dependent hydrolase [Ktedonobacteraceae bacterium]
MLGKSHLLVGLTAGVVLDSFVHLSGPPLTMSGAVPLSLVINKAIFYFMVGFGALLPDIDNARSTMGRKLGWISKEIQHVAGHRTLFHSILGLFLGSFLAIGLERLVEYLLGQRGFVFPAQFIGTTHLVFFAVLFGCVMHIAADGLTEGGVPLMWPQHRRYGFPPNPHMRFRTGDWPEFVIVYLFMLLVGIGIYMSYIRI